MENRKQNINEFWKLYNDKLLSKEALNNLINIHYPEEKINLTEGNKKEFVNQDYGKISIVIPTHNRLEQLKNCINSMLSQTYKNIEIIIIDDCSTDETKEYFMKNPNKKIRYFLNEKNLGMGLNRQKAFKVLTGDFVIFCDDDDYYIDDNYFYDAMKIFNENKNINVICSNSIIHYEKEDIFEQYKLNIPQQIESISYLQKFQFELKKPTSTFPAIFKKSCLDKANFSEMKMMNDSSIYLRAFMVGGITYYNNKIIGVYRVHEKNDTFNVKADFTIKNLEEKRYVYDYLKQNEKIKNIKGWYKKEIGITVKHFLNGNGKDKEQVNDVLKWIRNNVSNFSVLYFKVIYLKKKIRRNLRDEN